MNTRLLWAVLFVVVASWSAPVAAHAYPWMVKYGHTTCSQCHADPSGAGLLTEYGRAQGEIVLRSVYKKRDADWEPGKVAGFAFGALDLPESFLLGFSLRYTGVGSQFESGATTQRGLLMQSDLRAQLSLGSVRAYGSLAFAPFGGRPATLTSQDTMNVLSREHWLGYDVNDSILIRGGRLALPYGQRVLEHTLFARRYTKTDINSSQQHGLAFAYSGETIRGELMAIAGNLQVRPDEFRERGYSGYGEYTLLPGFAVGVSSLLASSQLDIVSRVPRVRQAHGITARGAISQKLVAYGEIDLLLDQLDGGDTENGHTGFVVLDYEPFQGIHLQGIYEWIDTPGDTLGLSSGFWVSVIWFALPHTDVRLDFNAKTVALPTGETTVVNSGLLHLHLYL